MNDNGSVYNIHESVYIDKNVDIGDGTKIWHFTHISENVEIGENCTIGQNIYVASDVKIGNGVKIQNNVSIYKGVEIEDDVFIGPSVVFTNIINPRAFIERKDEFKKTIIKKGVSIGANATIICGNIIGEYAFVGAGSVVTKDIINYTLAYGTPAEEKGKVCKCGNKMEKKYDTSSKCNFYICYKCPEKYLLWIDNSLRPGYRL